MAWYASVITWPTCQSKLTSDVIARHLLKGQRSERLAESFLNKQGVTILARNFRSKFGEIDLIARHKKELVFVEVRFRSSQGFGSAVETVNISKQRKLIKTAEYFLLTHPELAQLFMRFDVIGVDAQQNIEWIKGAFQSQS